MIDPNDPGTLDLIAACEEPLSGAERARRHRLKKKQAGVKAISLTHTERCVLSLGVLAHEDLFHRPADWVTSQKPGFDALLAKLWPEGDDGRYLAEPQRSTRRPAGFLHDELKRQRERVTRLEIENRRLREAMQQIVQEVSGGLASPAPAEAPGRVAALERENALLESERNGALAAVKVYVARLGNAKLSTDYRRQPGE
jgi:hypothetical protein